jgi:trypsin-like peptidase
MKHIKALILAGALAVLLHVGAVGVKDVNRQVFRAQSRDAAGAIFLNVKGQRRFICSGTVFGHTPTGDALFATARHCVWEAATESEDPDTGEDSISVAKLLGPEEVSFSANEQGPFYTAVPLKISKTDDVAILVLKNGSGLPAVRLGDERLLHSGDPLTNYTFVLDFGKMDMSLKAVAPAFAHYPAGLLTQVPEWSHSMPVDGMAALGSSGSALFDPRQRAIVGLVVGGGPRMGSLVIAIPVSRIWNLISENNNQNLIDPYPVSSVPVKAAVATKIKIPDDIFKSQFGSAHTFRLTAHDANPQFTQGGYVFKINTLGFGLSDEYYYAVPVFIDTEGVDGYCLRSTKKPSPSVGVEIVSKVE